MANYLKTEVLCEAYSHLEVGNDVDDNQKAILKRTLSAFFQERATFLYGGDVQVEVEFETGSLITKIRIIGTAAAIMATAVSDYGSFRQGVDQLTKDSALLAQSANLEMIFRTRAQHCDRISLENRRGVFGRVDSLLKELDQIKRDIAESSIPRTSNALLAFDKVTTKLLEWDVRADKLFGKLESEDTMACIAAGLLEEAEQIADSPPWADGKTRKSFRGMLATSTPALAAGMEASLKKYETTVKEIRKKYEKRLKAFAPTRA